MKKSVLIITILLVVSAIFVNAEVIKKSTLWGFGMKITGKAADELPSLTVQPINTSASVICSDSDKSSSYNMRIYGPDNLTLNRPDVFVFGQVNFNPPGKASMIINDACFNGTHLAEGFCQQDKYQGRQGITCPRGCKGGVCLTNETVAATTCTDSDGGLNTNTFGWTDFKAGSFELRHSDACALVSSYDSNGVPQAWQGPDPGQEQNWSCSGENCYVQEAFCRIDEQGNFIDADADQLIKCPNGCSNGVCLPAPVCSDSDDNMYFAGSANTALVGAVDYCDFTQSTRGILQEATCLNGNPTHTSITCPPTAPHCRNGICTTDRSSVCTDTDGSNTGTKGNITERTYSPSVVHTDYCEDLTTLQLADPCVGANCGVREYTCQRAYHTTTFNDVPCTYGCSNGACLPAPVCSDSDGGLNFSSKGYVKAAFGGGSDCCVDDKMQCIQNGSSVMELYCNPGSSTGFSEHIYQCPNGCQDGACFEHVIILGPPPSRISETVTCLFAFPTKTPFCTSSKGNCTGKTAGSSSCNVTISGSVGEKVTWTSDCGRNVAPATTTIDGTNENAGFVCIRIPRIRLP